MRNRQNSNLSNRAIALLKILGNITLKLLQKSAILIFSEVYLSNAIANFMIAIALCRSANGLRFGQGFSQGFVGHD